MNFSLIVLQQEHLKENLNFARTRKIEAFKTSSRVSRVRQNFAQKLFNKPKTNQNNGNAKSLEKGIKLEF